MEMALEFRGVSYRYLGKEEFIIKDINLKIPKGSFYVLAGPTGSGKTTMLMLARGLHKEYGGKFKGDIYVSNQNIKDIDIGELGTKVGLIFQDPASQLHQLRVIDEVRSAPMYQGLPWDECKSRAETIINEILDRTFYNRSPNDLSYGEQQKVALAACLAMKSEILLLDEPFSFLDVKASKEVLEIILKLKEKGITIILSTHNLEQVSRYTDRIALIDKGKVILEGPTMDILYSEEIEKIITEPLSIKIAKALIEKKKIKEKVVDWQDLLKKIRIKPEINTTQREEVIQNTALELNDVSYTFPDGTVGVKDVSLKIHRGEILGIIGKNGSGKTTLAKLVLGLLKPKKGKIRLSGEDVTKTNASEITRKIGYVAQDPIEMLFELTVLRECAFGPRCLKLKNPEQRAKETLTKLGLIKYKEKHPDSLSGGEKRLLTIADILVSNPQFLILDEPEFGLDLKTWNSIAETIRNLREEGKTIILITHNLEITSFLCDRIAVMSEGKVFRIGEPLKIFTDFELLKECGLLSLPLFEVFKEIKDKRTLSEKEFINTVVSFVEEV